MNAPLTRRDKRLHREPDAEARVVGVVQGDRAAFPGVEVEPMPSLFLGVRVGINVE